MDKKDINKEFKKAIKCIENFQNGKETNRIKVLKDVNKFKKLFNNFLNESFMKRIKDANGKELKIGDVVSFKYCEQIRLGTITNFNRVSDQIAVKYGSSRLDETYKNSQEVMRLIKE